jgi:hypothetical protein
MSNFYREPSKDASYQVTVHLAKGHHRQFLFLIGRFKKIFSSETAWPNEQKRGRKYQVSVHLAMRFQRRRFLEINQSETRIGYGGHVL